MRAPACLLALAVAAAAGGEAGCSAGFPVRHTTGGAGLHRLSGGGRAAPAIAHSALRLRGAGDAGNGMQPRPRLLRHARWRAMVSVRLSQFTSRAQAPLPPRGH